MMSDEEDVGDNTFKVHQPQWRSVQLNELLKELDQRAARNKGHARKNRVSGTPLKSSVPIAAKDWMVTAEYDSDASPTY